MYPAIRFKSILSIWGEEIIANLDKGFSKSTVNGLLVERAETLMWQWILGAYEVVRTMCQSKGCFSDSVTVKLKNLKNIWLKFECLQQRWRNQASKYQFLPTEALLVGTPLTVI